MHGAGRRSGLQGFFYDFFVGVGEFLFTDPVGHVETGLRHRNIYSSCPEEFIRQSVSILTRYNFVPTTASRYKLLSEGKDLHMIIVAGNTAIDALRMTAKED